MLALAALASEPLRPAASELKVVATSKPVHGLVASVMQGVGTPDLLVEGTASPHSYAMRPSDAQRVNRADVVFRISEALEPFTAKLFRTLPRTVRVSTLAEAPGVKLLPRRAGGPFESHTHAHGGRHAGHSHGNRGAAGADTAWDGHVWLDPDNAKAMARAIAAALSERAPARAALLNANAEALAQRIDRLASALGENLAPVAGRPFVVLHDAYQYFERRFGLSAIGSILVDPDEQPSAKRISDLRRKVAGLSAVCVFAEPNHQPRIVASVTEGTSSRTAVLDPEGTMIEPGPELYFKLLEQLAATMKSCLVSPV